MKDILKFVFQFSKKYVFKWGIYIFLCCGVSLIVIINPVVNGKFIDTLIDGKKDNNTINKIIIIVSIYVILMILGILFGYFMNKIRILLQYNISYTINKTANKHILNAPFSFIYKKIQYT